MTTPVFALQRRRVLQFQLRWTAAPMGLNDALEAAEAAGSPARAVRSDGQRAVAALDLHIA
jgi:hypothetical protein